MNRLAFVVACLSGTSFAFKLAQEQQMQASHLAQLGKGKGKGKDDKEHKHGPKHDDSKPLKLAEVSAESRVQFSHIQELDLAQVESTEVPECNEAVLRNRQAPVNFYDIYYDTTYGQFLDSSFPYGRNALYWENHSEYGDTSSVESMIEWQRISDVYPGHSLWGDQGIRPEDIIQGSLGNCWLKTAFSSVAEWPGRVEKIFLNVDNELSPNGIYGMTFYSLGVPHTVVVDDYVPTFYKDTSYERNAFGRVSADDGVWAAVAEKVFAKYHGNYEHLSGGYTFIATQTLTGGPYEYLFPFQYADESYQTIWDFVVQNDNQQNILTWQTYSGSNADNSPSGLVLGHAYSLIGAVTLSNGAQLLKCRNPWSSEKYHGPWNDSDPKWDEPSQSDPSKTLREEVGHQNADDGVFYMPLMTFGKEAYAVFVNRDTTNMSYASFLRLNDPDSGSAGTSQYCGSTCKRHELTVRNDGDVAQDLYISAHTLQDRHYPTSCHNYDRTTYHYLEKNGFPAVIEYYGDLDLSPTSVPAGGSVSIAVEFDWTPESGLDADWSLVAWGSENQPISITHDGGLDSHQHIYIDPIQNASEAEQAAADYQAKLNGEQTQGSGSEGTSNGDSQPPIEEETQPTVRALGDTAQDDLVWGVDYLFDPAAGCSWHVTGFEGWDDSWGVMLVLFNQCRSTYSGIVLTYTIRMQAEDWDLAAYYNNSANLTCQPDAADGSRTCIVSVGAEEKAGLIVPRPSDWNSWTYVAANYTWD